MPTTVLPYSTLLPRHRQMLEVSSGISPEVIQARGYFTEQSHAAIQALGFGRFQCRAPALIIPLWGLDGSITGYQARPDRPRVRDGKPVKYETPKGARLSVDVPPGAKRKLLDPGTPLFITEGIRKADSAVSRGLCCVAVIGVWGWSERDAFWDTIPFREREIYIAFDSDLSTNEQVQQAARKLRQTLAERGARVKVVVLGGEKPGEKQGLDDFFAQGGCAEELYARATADLPFLTSTEEVPGRHLGYRSSAEGLFHDQQVGEEVVQERLTNFPARIIADLIITDGVEQHREFEVEATVAGQVQRAPVPASEFPFMNWVLPAFGPQAILAAGYEAKEHARAAIQSLSGVVPSTTVYTHLGWIVSGKRRVFAHGAGVIGADDERTGPEMPEETSVHKPVNGLEYGVGGPAGPKGSQLQRAGETRVAVRAPSALALFRLPDPPKGEHLVEAVRTSLGMLKVSASDRLVLPLYAGIWRAPLGGVDYSIYLWGETGLYKSELAALAQQHYGAGMDREHLPANWLSTANANEGTAFLAKDVLLVVDDWLPRGSRGDVERANREADRLLRAQGNHSGRNRCNRDGSPKGQRPPRGLLLNTGEELPEGHSLNARLFALEVRKGDVDLKELSRCQEEAKQGYYAAAMAGYLQWLAPRYDRVIEEMSAGMQELRKGANALSIPANLPRHPRTATIVADLLAGFEVFLEFAVEIGAIDDRRSDSWWERLHDALVELIVGQARKQSEIDPVIQFLGYLAEALLSKQCHVTGPDGEPPETDATAWGWTEWEEKVLDKEGDPVGGARQTEPVYRTRRSAQEPKVGWVTPDGELFLLPKAALQVAQQMAQRTGNYLLLNSHTIGKKCHEKGVLLSRDEGRDRFTVRRNLEGARPYVLHLKAEAVIQRQFHGRPWEEPDWEGERPSEEDLNLDEFLDS